MAMINKPIIPLQVDYENESRRAQETSKALSRADRRVRELDFQV